VNILKELESAVSANQMPLFITGVGKYKVSDPWLETPTDLDAIFLDGFNEYISKHDHQDELCCQITNALVSLCSQPVGLWWCVFFVHNYYFGFKENTLLFSFDRKKVFASINKFILQHKNSLINNKEYVGYRFERGLWQHIENMLVKVNQTFLDDAIKTNS